MAVKYVQKRDNSLEKFSKDKITKVFEHAFANVGKASDSLEYLTSKVVSLTNKRYSSKIPSVEDISDIVEEVLIDEKHRDVAKSFIIFRDYKRKLREIKKTILGQQTKTPLSINAIKILEARYLLKNEEGKLLESPTELFTRISGAISKVESKYGAKKKQINNIKDKFYDLLYSLDFVPNSPTLMNAGTKMSQLSACFVLPIEDDIDSIFETLHHAAKIHQWVGGTGFSFSKIRPKGSYVSSNNGRASGPVSFIKVYDMETRVMNMGGKQRGANMAILRVDHPDIIDFITCKQREGDIANFNISVAITDKFMEALDHNSEYDLIDPHTGKFHSKMSAKTVFDLITNMAWTNGEPGVIFIDEINRHNMVDHIGAIESTNPCGEQPLLPYESCNLGAINLAHMVEDDKINWDKIKDTVSLSVRFLDNVIDANNYPIPQIDKMSKSTRKIGLGVMGFADMLLQLNIPYNSKKAVELGAGIMKFVQDSAIEASVELGKERGNFPAFKGSRWEKMGYKHIRNAALTTIAPTGTTSMIADCSSGIEPLFSIAYSKIALDDKEFVYVNKYFERVAKKRGFYSENLMYKIAKEGSIQHLEEIPNDVKELFVTTHDIETNWHIMMQSAFQKSVHSAVSKTINMSYDSTVEDVKEAYLLAHKLGCKGTTIYREGSRSIEVLKRGKKEKSRAEEAKEEREEKSTQKALIEKDVPKDECPICKKKMQAIEGCYTCPSCGYSKCSS